MEERMSALTLRPVSSYARRTRSSSTAGTERLEPRRLFTLFTGTVANDPNDNGVRDAGEHRLAGWTITEARRSLS